MTVTDEKKALRARMRSLRDGLETDDRLEWDQALAAHALSLPELTEAEGPAAGFWPMGSEADTRPILVALAERGVATCLPAVVDGELVFRAWTPWEPIVPGGFGTLVPFAEAAIVQPRLVLTPLLAFDGAGYRIGYGKGYYDRALARLRAAVPVLAVGVAYACQEADRIPTEPHDGRLDLIVTERGVIRPSG